MPAAHRVVRDGSRRRSPAAPQNLPKTRGVRPDCDSLARFCSLCLFRNNDTLSSKGGRFAVDAYVIKWLTGIAESSPHLRKRRSDSRVEVENTPLRVRVENGIMHHRLLLGSTALVGAGVLFTNATSAQEAQVGGLEVILGGYTEFLVQAASDDTLGNERQNQNYAFQMDNEIYPARQRCHGRRAALRLEGRGRGRRRRRRWQ